MKRICIFLVVTLLLMLMPFTLLAQAEESAAGASFVLDNENVYEGMDRAYKDGYTPSVKDGTATVVLPLLANGEIKGNMITTTPGLGDTSSSPFVYGNYQKTVQLNNHAVNGSAATVSCYLVRFDLPLVSARVNGVYPVAIEVQAQSSDSSPIQQTFTCYVTITDGIDPNAAAPTPRIEKPTSQPKIIVSGYSINPSPVTAGEEFQAIVTLKNTSATKSVQNMAVTVSCDSPNFFLKNDSSTIFLGKLGKGKTVDIELNYRLDLETPAQRYNIMLAIEYDNTNAVALSSAGMVPVMVTQPLRVKIETPKISSQVNAGDTMPVSIQVMNMGRSKVYNVRCELSVPGLLPSGTAYIGNMEPGTAANSSMDVFIGTKDMSEGYAGKDKYGMTSGNILLLYEDENGKEYKEEIPVSTSINPPVIQASADEEEEPEKTGQWWISVAALGAAIIGLVVFLLARGKKGKGHEDI
ncbi:MAG: COG1361 S-layer family protein [Christensenellales bacterium]